MLFIFRFPKPTAARRDQTTEGRNDPANGVTGHGMRLAQGVTGGEKVGGGFRREREDPSPAMQAGAMRHHTHVAKAL